MDGGGNRRSRDGRGLVSGIDVTVATTNAAGATSLGVPVDTPVIDDGVVFRYFARSVPGSWDFVADDAVAWANAGMADVVHVHASSPTPRSGVDGAVCPCPSFGR